MKLKDNSGCWRCHLENADFMHVAFTCQKLHDYWFRVLSVLEDSFMVKIPFSIQVISLSLFELSSADKGKKLVVNKILFLARLIIARKWRSSEPPAIGGFLVEVEKCRNYEKLMAARGGYLSKWRKIWGVRPE
ncbi:hypothetical protein GDO81_006299 [Engystomops pustulosus]|uniref:Reverse transcriptase zinc-binding domain-containing protein n=1 Tax=Engystomops pustulosus TaxID=76066 RepID=A0AAV7CWT4_ENGPU|nr:hypothetical protein GDO81_006299 [Engystomops pustulosus]